VTEPADPRAEALGRITALLLNAPVALTRDEASAAAGLTVEQARPYWRAMGFPDVGGDQVAFTSTDVAALQLLVGWNRSGLLDEARTLEIVRSLGQTASRLADWQVDTMARLLAEADEPVPLDRVGEGMAEVLPGLESLLVHAWRRHLAAVVGRVLALAEAGPGDPDGPTPEAGEATGTVGFADIAGFTRLARVLTDEALAAMVSAFETGAADLVAAHGARLVKTLGDEVMFVADEPADAVAIALAMHALRPAGEPMRLRIGLATGRLITVMGDYYGETVNRASRLTAIARPGGTMIDPATEEGLGPDTTYVVRHHRPRAVRGMGLVRASSVALPR
jgi:adenylate cyclase